MEYTSEKNLCVNDHSIFYISFIPAFYHSPNRFHWMCGNEWPCWRFLKSHYAWMSHSIIDATWVSFMGLKMLCISAQYFPNTGTHSWPCLANMTPRLALSVWSCVLKQKAPYYSRGHIIWNWIAKDGIPDKCILAGSILYMISVTEVQWVFLNYVLDELCVKMSLHSKTI